MDLKISKRERIETFVHLEIGRSELIDLVQTEESGIAIPDDAEVYIVAPSGGDCSGQRLAIGFDCPAVVISWREVSDDD